MMLKRKIGQSGTSLALHIPANIVEFMGLRKGSIVNLDYVDRKLTVEISAEASP